jgi:2-iminobutanoate/2-iminopropanoate deaminase
MKIAVQTLDAPKADHILSQAIVSNWLIFVSGQVYSTPDGVLVEGNIEIKLARVIRNIQCILQAAESDLENVVKVTLYITDMSILPEINKAWVQYFPQPLPAREAICVKELPLGASIAISVIATREVEKP